MPRVSPLRCRAIALAIVAPALWLCSPVTAADLDPFGGYTGLKSPTRPQGTGSYQLERIGDRWWFVSPAGNVQYSIGLNHVTLYSQTDANGDGVITAADADSIGAHLTVTGSRYKAAADLNADGRVDDGDLSLLSARYGAIGAASLLGARP